MGLDVSKQLVGSGREGTEWDWTCLKQFLYKNEARPDRLSELPDFLANLFTDFWPPVRLNRIPFITKSGPPPPKPPKMYSFLAFLLVS